MKPIAVAFSDVHIHNWKTHNKDGLRTKAHSRAVLEIGGIAKDLGVPVLFPGDWGHAFGKVDLELWEIFIDIVEIWRANKYPAIIGITGNHDQESANYDEDQQSRSTWKIISRIWPDVFINVDFAELDQDNFRVFGIPYLTYNKSFDKWVTQFKGRLAKTNTNILMVHTDLHGATEATGREVGTVEGIPDDMQEYFRGFDIVLSGHIHTPQKLGKRILMVGAPLQQKRSDIGSDYGYWIIEAEGHKVHSKFIPLFDYPKFVQLQPGEEPAGDGNYYLPPEEVVKDEQVDTGFSNTVSKEKLVKRYFRSIGEKSVSKKKALINILTEADGDWQ